MAFFGLGLSSQWHNIAHSGGSVKLELWLSKHMFAWSSSNGAGTRAIPQGDGRKGGDSRIGGEPADDEDGEGDASQAASRQLVHMAIGPTNGGAGNRASGALA